MTPYLIRKQNGVSPIFHIAYATFQFETYKTRSRSSFHLNLPKPLFNRKITFLSAFSLTSYLTPYSRGYNGIKPIFYIAYATAQLQTFPPQDRSTLYLILSYRHLFNRKMTFKVSGRCRRRSTLALCK